jgi:hypothetical protein
MADLLSFGNLKKLDFTRIIHNQSTGGTASEKVDIKQLKFNTSGHVIVVKF